jgi:hypothetical protein
MLKKQLGKAFASNVAQQSGRGRVKEALKREVKEEGISDKKAREIAKQEGITVEEARMRRGVTDEEAKNKAHFLMRQAEGKETAVRTTGVKQDRDTSGFKKEASHGGNKTLAIQNVDTKTGRTVSTKTDTDKNSTLRATERRQARRAAGEAMYEAGLKEAAKTRAKEAVAGLGIASAGYATVKALSKDEEEQDKRSTERRDTGSENKRGDSGPRDERVNKEDYPTYRKDTKSAESFREAFKSAKDEGKDSFSWEGRKYSTEEASGMAKGGMVKAKKKVVKPKPFSVGGYAKLYGKK